MKTTTLCSSFHFSSLGMAIHQLFMPKLADACCEKRFAPLLAAMESQPALRTWVLALSGKSSRTQRALLARAMQFFGEELGDEAAVGALAELHDPALLRAVLAELATLVDAV